MDPMTEVSETEEFGLNGAIAERAMPIGPPVALLLLPGEVARGTAVEVLVVFRFTVHVTFAVKLQGPMVVELDGPSTKSYLRVVPFAFVKRKSFATRYAVQSEYPGGRTGTFPL